MSDEVVWIETTSWEVPFFGLPSRIPWPKEVDPKEADAIPMNVSHLQDAIERLGPEAGQPWTGFLEASDAIADLGDALQDNDSEAALNALDEVDRLLPNTAFALFQRALLARREGDDESAIALYREAVEIAPKAPPIWSNLGAVLAMRGEKEEAIKAFRQALALAPQDAMSLEGMASLKQLVKLRSMDPQRQNHVIFVEPEQFRESALKQVEALTNPEQLFGYADQLMREGSAPHAAVRALERANELQPGQPRWTQALSAAYHSTGEHEKALETLRRYTELYPQDVNGWILLANAQQANGHATDKRAALEKALALDVNSQPALGMWFELAPGEHDPAKQDELAAWGAQHNSWMAYLLAGLVAAERGDIRASHREVEKAYAINPEHEEVLLHYTSTLGQLKELGKLASIIRPAVESGKYTKRLDWHYAHVLKQLNVTRDALATLEGILKSDIPEDFRHMVETTRDAWQELITGGGIRAEVMPGGFLQRPILIALPDGDDGGILVAAGAQLPANAKFSWKAQGAKTMVGLQQGESASAREPLDLGFFRIRAQRGSGQVECHLVVLPDGAIHFRATEDDRKVEVAWSPVR